RPGEQARITQQLGVGQADLHLPHLSAGTRRDCGPKVTGNTVLTGWPHRHAAAEPAIIPPGLRGPGSGRCKEMSIVIRDVREHELPGPGLRAAMLVKELCSFQYVHETYADKLPDQPWLVARALPGRKPHLATGT